MKTLIQPYTKQEYIDFIAWCNANNCHPVATDDGYTAEENPAVVTVEDTTPTMEERLAQLKADNETLNDTIIALAEELETALSTAE